MNPVAEDTLRSLTTVEFPLESLRSVGIREYQPCWKADRIGLSSSLYYVLSGQVSFTLNGHTHVCGAHTMFYLEHHEQATMANPDAQAPCALLYITFHLKPGLTLAPFGIPRPLEDNEHKFLQLTQQLYRTHLAEGPAYKIKEFYELSQLFYELLISKLRTGEGSLVDRKLWRAVEYVKVNYRKSITIEELSQLVGYSTSHFRRLFVKTFGISPQEYILLAKIRHAKRLLVEQDYTVAEISDILGFCNTSYFCKLFKVKTGQSPRQYQKSNTDQPMPML